MDEMWSQHFNHIQSFDENLSINIGYYTWMKLTAHVSPHMNVLMDKIDHMIMIGHMNELNNMDEWTKSIKRV
jgi:macrodomain Ter protein organizer (MatP/YcbG family)